MDPPEIKQFGRIFKVSWPLLKFHVARIKEDSRVLSAEISSDDGQGRSFMNHLGFNLKSGRARAEIVRHLNKFEVRKIDGNLMDETELEDAVEKLIDIVIDGIRSGSKPEAVAPIEEVQPPTFLVDPLIPYGVPTILFGKPGAYKSAITDWLTVLIAGAAGCTHEGMNFRDEPTAVLRLDWETDRDTFFWRVHMHAKGLGLGTDGIFYRRCYAPLEDDLEEIQQYMLEIGASVIVVDSAGYACKGNLNFSEVALAFFRTVRALEGTCIIITHDQKDNLFNKQSKTPFGSQYFLACARSIWRVIKDQELESNVGDVGLFHDKVNEGRLFKPRGLRFTFESIKDGFDVDRTVVRAISISDTALVKDLPLHIQIQTELKTGPLTIPELEECLEKSADAIRARLNEFRTTQETRPKMFVKLENKKWGLAHIE